MPIWKSGPLLAVAVLIVAETVTQLNFTVSRPLKAFLYFPPNSYQLYTATRHYALGNIDFKCN